jgi:cysteine sulfinate desulfinase/cysteine desulfurase-like protein
VPYLDYAASAPLRAETLAAMLPLLERPAANPSSQHRQGLGPQGGAGRIVEVGHRGS